ncbi:hypothetical protein RRF57_004842 [Xylaria bambusicola]|uniref:Heterokaryon incompatibility domain-containing protein n=1 Tax=Xylaria bambusicola TaxID=326684 RepID=A0AAN7UIE5_9PEZI
MHGKISSPSSALFIILRPRPILGLMWLINCQELTLVEVGSVLNVQYAILSHTWEAGEEVQFDEFRNQTATTKRGWDKIRRLCRLAIDEGYQFAWCDTCCINKTSSSELSEAINSMFHWYATAVRFYDASWRAIGTKATLSEALSNITGIARNVLFVAKDRDLDDVLGQVSVAARMSWAAKRETTRVEDLAYCLLGIFGVNLPLLYGEGERAFIRLQEEIVKTNNDLSLFAWRSANSPLEPYRGVFAQRPGDFQNSGGIILANSIIYNSEFTMSNKGVKIEMNLSYSNKRSLHVLFLNCHNEVERQANLGIFLIHQGASIFARAQPQFPSIARSLDKVYRRAFIISNIQGEGSRNWSTGDVGPKALWDSGQRMFITAGLDNFVGYYQYQFYSGESKTDPGGFYVFFGYGYGLEPWLRAVALEKNYPLLYAVEIGDMRLLAQEVQKIEPQDNIAAEYGVAVELVYGAKNGEPVFVVDCQWHRY